MKTKAYYMNLTGSHYEVGNYLRNIVKALPDAGESYKIKGTTFSKKKLMKFLDSLMNFILVLWISYIRSFNSYSIRRKSNS